MFDATALIHWLDNKYARHREIEDFHAARLIEQLKSDRERVDWIMPIISGDDEDEPNLRTFLVGLALVKGLRGREAIDDAMKERNKYPVCK